MITLYKTGKHGKMLYYTLHDRQAVLTGHFPLFIAWRAGEGSEREIMRLFDTRAERDAAVRKAFSRKLREGYRLLYSFDRAEARDRGATGAEGAGGGESSGGDIAVHRHA